VACSNGARGSQKKKEKEKRKRKKKKEKQNKKKRKKVESHNLGLEFGDAGGDFFHVLLVLGLIRLALSWRPVSKRKRKRVEQKEKDRSQDK